MMHHPGRTVAKCAAMLKKVAKSFGGLEKSSYLCPRMKEPLYHITGVSRLTGSRESVSLPMEKLQALALLEAEKQRRRNRRHAAYTRLKVEKITSTQLTLNFE